MDDTQSNEFQNIYENRLRSSSKRGKENQMQAVEQKQSRFQSTKQTVLTERNQQASQYRKVTSTKLPNKIKEVKEISCDQAFPMYTNFIQEFPNDIIFSQDYTSSYYSDLTIDLNELDLLLTDYYSTNK